MYEPLSDGSHGYWGWHIVLLCVSVSLTSTLHLLVQSLRKDLQQLHHDKVELQREIEQRSSELTTSREEVEAVREELKAVREEVEAVRDSMLAKSNEAEQAQGLVHQQQEEVARLEARCQVR